MKKIITLSLCFFVLHASYAQSEKFISAMKTSINELDSAKNADQFMQVSNKFERIAVAEKTQWLPYYYAALARTTSSFLIGDKSKMDDILDIADKYIKISDSLSPNNSEISVVRGMILAARIMVDPAGRGMQYGIQSNMALGDAMLQDPNNPRVYLMMGQSLFYTPEQFGGGKVPACERFKKAKEQFATFKPLSAIHPNWGQKQNDQMLQQCTEVNK